MAPSIKAKLKDIDQLSRQLEDSIYLVGGTVRDQLLGRSCMDYDFAASHAPEIARTWAQQTGLPLVPLDETPGRETFRIVLDQNLYFDFTTLQGKYIEDDLNRRDFTINAIAIPLTDFIEDRIHLIDPFRGEKDLHQKIIRVVREQAFEEDPLRLLRAFRFASTLEFSIDPQTLIHIRTHRNRLTQVAKERVSHELLLLLGAHRSRLDLMDPTELIKVLFPDLEQSKPEIPTNGTQQESTLDVFREAESFLNHPDQFLKNHAQLIRDFLSANHYYTLIKWSALMHSSTEVSGSASRITDLLKEFRLSNADIQFIDRTLKFAQIILSGARSTSIGFKEDAAIYQFIHRSGNTLISSIILSIAVRLGKQEDIKYPLSLVNRILDFYTEKYLPAKARPVLLNGDILKDKFQLEPSPRFKRILDKVEEARVLGTIQTPEEAEDLAKKLISSQVELAE